TQSTPLRHPTSLPTFIRAPALVRQPPRQPPLPVGALEPLPPARAGRRAISLRRALWNEEDGYDTQTPTHAVDQRGRAGRVALGRRRAGRPTRACRRRAISRLLQPLPGHAR